MSDLPSFCRRVLTQELPLVILSVFITVILATGAVLLLLTILAAQDLAFVMFFRLLSAAS